MSKRRIIFVSVVCLSLAVFSVQTLSQVANANRTFTTPDTENSQFINKIAKSLNINWRSIEYEKTLYNPVLTSNRRARPKAESLFLACKIEMPDSGLVLTTCPDAVIEQITDGRGVNIEIDPLLGKTIKYIHQPRFSRSSMPAGRQGEPEYRPLWVEFDTGLLERIRGEFGFKGHFYALIAESFDYVELPFEPNDNWVSITPDVEIRIRKARNEASSYQFEIEQRPEMVADLFNVQVGDYLPDRLVVDRQIIVQKSSEGAGGFGSYGRIGGTGSGTGRAEKILFTIAVNPAHRTVPFEFEQIPLSAIAEQSTSQARSSNQTEPPPVTRIPGPVKPQFDEKVAKWFDVKWSSVAYSKTLYNPADSENSRDESVSENLIIRCQANILDPKLVLGTCDIPVVEQIKDINGLAIDIRSTLSRFNRMSYRTLRYNTSFSPPSRLVRLEGKVRTTLRLPLLPRHQLPKRSLALQSVRLGIKLDPGLFRRDMREIGGIKGYFHALAAESLRHVKIPFESSDKWVRLTGDVEIQVSKARQTGSASLFEIRQRVRPERRVFGLGVGDQLPDEIVVDRQFIGADGRSTSPGSRGGRPLPGNIIGSGGISGRQIRKIDFQIAVGPSHYKIPFEIEHIPLPIPFFLEN